MAAWPVSDVSRTAHAGNAMRAALTADAIKVRFMVLLLFVFRSTTVHWSGSARTRAFRESNTNELPASLSARRSRSA